MPPFTKTGGRGCAALAVALFVVGAFASPAAAAVPALVSVATPGGSGNGDSMAPAPSGDGRFVAFASGASDLVAGDTNAADDVFVRDVTAGVTERISVATDGTQANAPSFDPVVSADGRSVAFTSIASNLVPGDTNARADVFVRDRVAGTTERVSVSSASVQSNGVSGAASMSADGRLVAFESAGTNLVTGDTNVRNDVFLRDRQAGTTTRVSLTSSGVQSNGFSNDAALSADGTRIAYASTAGNLAAGDTNMSYDVFVRVLSTGATTRVSVATDGTQGNSASRFPAMSADGGVVVFESLASTLVAADGNGAHDVFVHSAGVTSPVSIAPDGSAGNGASTGASISGDGSTVVFTSSASNLIDGDTNGVSDVFSRDLPTAETSLVSEAPGGPADGASNSGAVSGDGAVVVFSSGASSIAAGDANGRLDVFRASVIKDADGDGVLDLDDNCVDVGNPDQVDTDADHAGDACDPDDDGDGVADSDDVCALLPGLASRQGCPAGVSTSFVVEVKGHAKAECGGASHCETHPSGAVVRLYDRNAPAFLAAYGADPSSEQLDAIFAGEAGRTGECVTSDGGCIAGTAAPSDVLAIVRLAGSGLWVYASTAVDRVAFTDTDADGSGDLGAAEVEVTKHVKKDKEPDFKAESVKVVPQ